LTNKGAIEDSARARLLRACDDARAVVAENPQDEAATLVLRDVVERFARAFPYNPDGLDAPQAVLDARQLIALGRLEEAEILVRAHLRRIRHDPTAMHLMAEIAAKCDLREDAERILRESARIHAHSHEAWTSLGMTLHRIACEKDYPDFLPQAIKALDEALRCNPDFEPAQAYKASIFIQTRGLELGYAAFERLLEMRPQGSMHWLNFGYVLKTMGEFGRGVAAYRTATALDPTNGAAWWGLANLKVASLFDHDVEAMETVLDDPDLPDPTRVDISFALAKALDERKQYEAAARRLEQGNRIRAKSPTRHNDVVGSGVEFTRNVFTRRFFEDREGWGDPRPEPIFIVGMPRAGSTLVEQILASHSRIEGTEELFVLHQLETELGTMRPGMPPADLVRGLSEKDCVRLGGRYLDLASRSRHSNRPLFTDKNPANWRYTGLIHCILPNAKIIDVRRNPMDCCFANYRQHFHAGLDFSYDQGELGRHYRDYVGIMRHFDDVLPGRVYRLIHDDLVDDFEGQVRRLLQYVGVEFEESCLRFFETKRAIFTPSAEQVRQPINRSGFGIWRNYEPWLGELKSSLGDLLDDWRA